MAAFRAKTRAVKSGMVSIVWKYIAQEKGKNSWLLEQWRRRRGEEEEEDEDEAEDVEDNGNMTIYRRRLGKK